MTISQLQCFAMTAKCGNITRAADALYISQPAITLAISSLEKELGAVLFERAPRKMTLTNMGKKILISAQLIADECDRIINVCSNPTPDRNIVTFAAPVIPRHIAQVVKGFVAAHKLISLQRISEFRGTPEVTVGATVDDNFNEMKRHVMTEELALVVPSKHRLYGAEMIDFKELGNIPVVSLVPGTAMRRIEDHYYETAGVKPLRVAEIASFSEMMEVIYSDEAIAFFPCKTWGIEVISQKRIVRLTNPRCYRYIYAEERLHALSNLDAVTAFFNFIVSFFFMDRHLE
ncbi:MAG: LysR family transcriptional regulator [Oscillospiraceae bacterium]|nr:LysR family transcriptional regulator [Oscillospiraceae bacterium]